MKELTITKINIMSIGKLVGVWYAIVGLAVGLVGSVSSAVAIVTNNNYSTLADVLIIIGVILSGIIFVPLVMFVLGWIHGAILGLIFDVISRGTGGLKIEVTDASNGRR